jgi:hypothetical protein
MKEDIIAANLSSIRQSIEQLKKNNSSQSSKNVPNWDELENKIAQAAANEVRILLEKRQQKFKEEEEQRKAETEEYQNSVSEGYDDIINKLKKLSEYWDKVYHNFYHANKEQEKQKTAIENIEEQLTAINGFIQNSLQQPYEFPVMPNTPKGLISYILADIPSYWAKRIWHSKHVKNLMLIILICLWAISIGVTGFIIRDNMALHEGMQLMELQWRK